MRALYLGRFNPPHKGHIHAIEHILEQPDIDEIIILIGSGEKAYSIKNPFTGGERLEMLTTLVRKRFDITKFYIASIPDVNRNTIWPANVIDLVPSFDVVFTNNPLVIELFAKLAHKEVREVPLASRSDFKGKEIRKQMIKGGNWEKSVPEEVVKLISKFDGVKRIKTVNLTDEVEEIEHNKT
ncbi:MAG: nicotinamide-nucleotide adenylyltransferase [Candidatus Heimdallarchaeota archaeon]|nr:nicotinamide-nucleotide adenylyltransferase [Candidatus Heimdallarchaeota archaeon]